MAIKVDFSEAATFARSVSTASPPIITLHTILCIYRNSPVIPACFGHFSPTCWRFWSHIFYFILFLNNLSTFPHSKIIYFVPGGTSFTFWSSCSSCFPPTHRKSRQELTFLLTSCQTWLRFLNNEIIALWGFFFFFSQPLLKINMDQVTKIQTLGVRCIQWPENT